MLQHKITRSITCLVAIALLAWNLPVAAYDIGDDGFRFTSRERKGTSVVAFEANDSTYRLLLEDVRVDVNWYIRSVAHQQQLQNTSPSKAGRDNVNWYVHSVAHQQQLLNTLPGEAVVATEPTTFRDTGCEAC